VSADNTLADRSVLEHAGNFDTDTDPDTDADADTNADIEEEIEELEKEIKKWLDFVFRSGVNFSERSDNIKKELRKQLKKAVPQLLMRETAIKNLKASVNDGHNELKIFVSWHTNSADLMRVLYPDMKATMSRVRSSRHSALFKLNITSAENNEVIKALGFYTPQGPKTSLT
jgi:hypothetical protein